jgi:hypothetical protein
MADDLPGRPPNDRTIASTSVAGREPFDQPAKRQTRPSGACYGGWRISTLSGRRAHPHRYFTSAVHPGMIQPLSRRPIHSVYYVVKYHNALCGLTRGLCFPRRKTICRWWLWGDHFDQVVVNVLGQQGPVPHCRFGTAALSNRRWQRHRQPHAAIRSGV